MQQKQFEAEQRRLDAEARAAQQAAQGSSFSFKVPEDADLSNPIHAFADCMNKFQG